MKYVSYYSLFLLACLVLTGCSTAQPPVGVNATDTQISETSTVVPSIPTDSSVPAMTPTFTLTPSPTMHLTATNTLELREKGYDIADVRLSFPGKDTLVVDFKYRVDESRASRDTYIFMFIPPQCRDDTDVNSPLNYVAKDLVGEARFTFNMTIKGECNADGIDFRFHSDPNWEANPPFYREFVQQPYRLTRNFPTVNSDTLSVENFEFTADVPWKGVFTFNYIFSDDIPIPPEEYFFIVRGFGSDGGCAFWANGPIITAHSGEYQIPLDLADNLLFPYKNCLQGLEKYTYTTSFLYLRDWVAEKDVYSQALSDSYTVWRSR